MLVTDYVTLGVSGLRVSPFAFGGGTLGTKAEDKALLQTYIDRGGNFVDTAEIYGFYGKSEEWLGQFLAASGLRDRLVISSKFGPNIGFDVNCGGNGRKNLIRALNDSLLRLRSDYLDLYWLHVWDTVTPVDEVVETMNDQVRAGKIRYYGLSNVPAWYAARAYTLAHEHRLSRPIALQMQYSLIERNIEYEHLPVARELGLGICAYSPLGDGFLSGKYRRTETSFEGAGRLDSYRQSNFAFGRQLSSKDWLILDELVIVARELGRSAAQIALSWLAHQPGITMTLIGASQTSQLEENLDAASIEIPPEMLQRLNAISVPYSSYPYNMFSTHFRGLLERGMTIRPWNRQR